MPRERARSRLVSIHQVDSVPLTHCPGRLVAGGCTRSAAVEYFLLGSSPASLWTTTTGPMSAPPVPWSTSGPCVIVAFRLFYPHGIVDPVVDLAGLAAGMVPAVKRRLHRWVRAPFLEMLGRPVPPWDFRVDGVTEISMDLHKYGYVPKVRR